MLQPVSWASGLLSRPAEPTAFSRRHLIIAGMQPSWRQFREEQGERRGVEGIWRWCWRWRRERSSPGEVEAFGSVGPSREPEKLSICAPASGEGPPQQGNKRALGGKGWGAQTQASIGPSRHPFQPSNATPPVATSATLAATEEMLLPHSGRQKEEVGIQEGPTLPTPILLMVTPA